MERLTISSILTDGYALKEMCTFELGSAVQDKEMLCYEQCSQNKGWDCEDCAVKKAIDRLAAYEDTGYTPEEIEALKTDNDRLHRLIDELENSLRKEN